MTHILPPLSHYHVKRLYQTSHDGKRLICKTCKVASTFIREHTHGWPQTTPEDAVKHAQEGKRAILFVREPLDRFISAFEYFRKGNITSGFIRDDRDRVKVISKDTEIEEWFELIKKWPNEHWTPQTDLHTHDGFFVPNEMYPVESLRNVATPVNRSPGRHETEWYFKDRPEFKALLEDHFYKDVNLYNKVLEDWNGSKPRSVF